MTTQHLLEAIARTVPLSSAVEEAFRQVDRALFVPTYYRHQGAEWTREPAGSLVYEDRALTTQMRNGLPSSSSSQPSVMAVMLEALAVHPGMQVLEVGTGTGYNAAILAQLVGTSGQVTTVDVDDTLLDEAQQRLRTAGCAERVTVRQVDGRTCVSETATFDRILLTASFRAFEPAWEDQLAASGIVVGNLQGPLSSVLLLLQKDQEQQMQGRLLPHSAFFMALHGPAYPTLQAPDWSRFEAIPRQSREANPALLQALRQQAFLFFLHGQLPQAQVHLRAIGTPEQHDLCTAFLSGERIVLLHQNGSVEASGSLWEEIAHAYQRYQQMGTPALADYQVRVEQHSLWASIQGETWLVAP
jgi:protein-L-isoaspartate(D-aspartate) O-methyltransferase